MIAPFSAKFSYRLSSYSFDGISIEIKTRLPLSDENYEPDFMQVLYYENGHGSLHNILSDFSRSNIALTLQEPAANYFCP